MKVNAVMLTVLLAAPAGAGTHRGEGSRDLRPAAGVVGMEKPKPAPKPDHAAVMEVPEDERAMPAPNSPRYAEALWERAAVRHQRSRPCDAAEDLDELVRTGQSLDRQKAMAGRAFLACAVLLVRRGEFDTGGKRADQARALLGDVPELNRVMGPILRMESEQALANEDLPTARERWDRARSAEPDLTDNPRFGARLLSVAEAAMERSQLDRARTFLAAAKDYTDSPKVGALERALRVREVVPVAGLIGAALAALLVAGLAVQRVRDRRRLS